MYGPIDSKTKAKFGIVTPPSVASDQSMASQIILQSGSGLHISVGETRNSLRHYTVKAPDDVVTGHLYENGVMKGVNRLDKNQGRAGGLAWMMPNLDDK